MIFRPYTIYGQVSRVIQSYWHINAFLTNANIKADYIEAHRRPKPVRFTDRGLLLEDGTIVEMPDDDLEIDEHTIVLSEEEITTNLEEAEKSYNRQMVVVASTYVELALKDFMRALFCAHPDRMYEFIEDSKGAKGYVSIKEIIKSSSIPEVISELAEQASSNALKGSFSSQLKNLSRVAKEDQLGNDLKLRVTAIVEQRNRIVHEASLEIVSADQVRSVFDSCLELIKFLAGLANECGVPLEPTEPAYPF